MQYTFGHATGINYLAAQIPAKALGLDLEDLETLDALQICEHAYLDALREKQERDGKTQS